MLVYAAANFLKLFPHQQLFCVVILILLSKHVTSLIFNLVVPLTRFKWSLFVEATMADNNHEELNHLRGLVMNLANEIDYKNHLLMEKEGLSLEKFATMSSLIEEKDRLLDEKSAVIGSLMAQKHRLHEVYVEGNHVYPN